MHSPRTQTGILLALLACGILFGTAGCAGRRAQAAPPVATPSPEPPESKPEETAPAPPKIEAQPTPVPLPPSSTSTPVVPPPKPRKPTSETESPAEQPAHPSAPLISPQLSPADVAAYQRKINEDSAVAENNLLQINKKHLNAGQQDLHGKILSFLAQSRDASKGGDWARAQNLAQKARLLSVELVNSF